MSDSIIRIKGKHESDVLPHVHSDLKKKTLIDNNSIIRGHIMGNDIEIKSKSICGGDVFSKADILLNNNDQIIILGSLLSNGFVKTMHDKKEINTYIQGNITANIINIKNAIVFGSIYAKTVNLEDSIILGPVYASNSISLSETTLLNFYTPEIKNIKNTSLFFFNPVFDLNEDSLQTIRWIPFCFNTDNKCPKDKFLCTKFIKGKCDKFIGLSKYDSLDFDNKTKAFNILNRIVDIRPLEDTFYKMKKEIHFLVNRSKILDSDKLIDDLSFINQDSNISEAIELFLSAEKTIME